MKNWCKWWLRVMVAGLFFLRVHTTLLVATSITTTAPGGDPLTGYQETAPTFSNGDRIRGHVIFKDGFTLANGADVTWDAHGVVNGQLNRTDNSIFSLKSDLQFGSAVSFASTNPSAFRLQGNGKKMICGGNITMPQNKRIWLEGNEVIIDGQGHAWSLNNVNNTSAFYSAFYGGYSGSALTLKNIVFNGAVADGTGLFDVASVVLDNVKVRGGKATGYTSLCKYTLDASSSSLTIRGRVELDMPSRRIKLQCGINNLVVTIEKNSTLYIGKNNIFEWLNTADGGSITINFADKTSVLHLDGCDFYTGANGLTLTKGTVIFENKVRIFNKDYDSLTPNTDMTKGLIFGDGTSENAVDVKVLGGAYVTVEGCLASK